MGTHDKKRHQLSFDGVDTLRRRGGSGQISNQIIQYRVLNAMREITMWYQSSMQGCVWVGRGRVVIFS